MPLMPNKLDQELIQHNAKSILATISLSYTTEILQKLVLLETKIRKLITDTKISGEAQQKIIIVRFSLDYRNMTDQNNDFTIGISSRIRFVTLANSKPLHDLVATSQGLYRLYDYDELTPADRLSLTNKPRPGLMSPSSVVPQLQKKIFIKLLSDSTLLNEFMSASDWRQVPKLYQEIKTIYEYPDTVPVTQNFTRCLRVLLQN